MHWNIDASITPSDYEGFIYRITSKSTGRFYIGRKSVWARSGKGKKQTVRESNWKSYKSSCKELKEAIKAAPDDWTYEILQWAKDGRSLSYLEEKYQMLEEVLEQTMPDGTRLSYNGNIGGRYFKGPTL